MNLFNLLRISFALLFVLLAGSSCDRTSKPLPPLPLEQLPAALEKAFSKAETDTKDLAGSVAAAVRAQDYAKAYPDLQNLAGKSNLSQEQADVTTRGSLTVHQALQQAQEKGDAAAAQTLQYNRQNR
ncbi:MAG: hypothetical protein WCK27_26930 [Verrucomicrobiota bacterium]